MKGKQLFLVGSNMNESFLHIASLQHEGINKKVNFSLKMSKQGWLFTESHQRIFSCFLEKNEVVFIQTIAKDRKDIIGVKKELARVAYKGKELVFKVEVEGVKAEFYYRSAVDNLKQIGESVDITALGYKTDLGFNGTYIGMYATSNGMDRKNKALFDWFNYKELE